MASRFYWLPFKGSLSYLIRILAQRKTFGKVMSLLFNILSMVCHSFSSKEQGLLTSWLHSPSAVILEPKKIKALTVSSVSPSVFHEVMGPDAMIFIF